MAVGCDGSGGFADAHARDRWIKHHGVMRCFPHSARHALLPLVLDLGGQMGELCGRLGRNMPNVAGQVAKRILPIEIPNSLNGIKP